MEYLVLKDITKRYRDTDILANDHISLSISKGEIHAIVGDNGAGKSTLGKILYGVIKKDKGEVFLNGERLRLSSEKEARSAGIYFVPQEDFLIENFKVWENIVLGGEDTTFGFLNGNRLKKKVLALMEKYNLYLPLDVPSSSLSVGQKRMLSILKALYKNPKILILDEPTSFLPEPEVEDFLKILLSLKRRGITIIFISHRQKEVEKVADRVTLLDKGKVVGTYTKEEFSEMIEKRFGPFSLSVEREFVSTEKVIFKLSHVYRKRDGEIPLHDINIEVKNGEILAILSISGNGEKELEAIVSGYISPDKGEIYLKGKKLDSLSPAVLRKNGVSIIPTELEDGVCDHATLWENMIISRQKEKGFSKGYILNSKYIKKYTLERLGMFDLPYSSDTKANSLSGGRKRRLILSRELREDRDLIIAGNPTSSLDSAFTKKTLDLFKRLSFEGKGILFFSHNIDDALLISHRIVVLYKGKVNGNFRIDKVTKERLIRCLIGEDNV